MRQGLDTVVFDIGGVLIDWDPRHLYRKLFPDDDQAMEHFLATVTTMEWNSQMDGGRPFAESVADLTARFPEHRDLIAAYHARWTEMLGGAIDGSVELLAQLRQRSVPCYALTNFSAEMFPVARDRFGFLGWFDGVLVSGEEGLVKPDPAIFARLAQRFGLEPGSCLFVDDLPANVEGGRAAGFAATLFRSPEQLRRELVEAGLLSA